MTVTSRQVACAQSPPPCPIAGSPSEFAITCHPRRDLALRYAKSSAPAPAYRAAISKFQEANGFPESAYLTAQQRQTLLAYSDTGQSGFPEVPDTGQIGPSGGRRFPETRPQGFPQEPEANVRLDRSQAELFPTAQTDSPVAPEFRVPSAAQTDAARTGEVTGIGK